MGQPPKKKCFAGNLGRSPGAFKRCFSTPDNPYLTSVVAYNRRADTHIRPDGQ